MRERLPVFAKPSRPLLALIAVSAAVAFAVRIPFFYWPLTVDEAGYAYGARWWFSGLTMYSDDLWFDRPQGIFLAYQSGMAFLGGSTEAIRIIGAVWSMASTAAVVALTARMFNLRIAAIAGPLFAVISVAPAIDGYASNAEVFMIAAATWSAFFVWRRHWFAAGLMLGIAVLLKPSGGVGLLLGAFWLFQLRAPRRDWIAFFAGTAVPMALATAHGFLTVGVADYLYATVWFRLTTGGEDDPIVQLLQGWSRVTPVIFPLLLTVLAGSRALRAYPTQYRFMSVWVATAFLGIAMGGNWWEHYFLQAIPPLIVMTAVVIDSAITMVRRSAPGLVRRVSVHAGAATAGIAVSVVALVTLITPWALMDPVEGSSLLYDMNGYELNEEISGYIAERTEPSDEIFVGISHASLVYLTGRQSSYPYLYKQQTSEIPGAISGIADQLEAGVPAYVLILPAQLERYDPDDLIWAAVRESYEYERSFRSAELWRRR